MSKTVTVPDNLEALTKSKLVNLVIELQKENTELVAYNSRLEALERRMNLHEQYNRRESVEISGIDKNITQANLEDKVIEIFAAAEIEVHGKALTKHEINK